MTRGMVLVRGVGDVGSAVAHVLFRAGHPVVIHDVPKPAVPRRGMAFADALFDGRAVLDGITARHVDGVSRLREMIAARAVVPTTTMPFKRLLGALNWDILVDARMRKRTVPEAQRGSAGLTVGLGPNFTAGVTVDLAIETSWERLGQIVWSGPTLPLAGEPRAILGVGRERFVYAPAGGVFRTHAQIGELVAAGSVIAALDEQPLTAPIGGMIRGLVRDSVPVARDTKVIEVDPRGDRAVVFGLGKRPRRIAGAVLRAIRASTVNPPAAG